MEKEILESCTANDDEGAVLDMMQSMDKLTRMRIMTSLSLAY